LKPNGPPALAQVPAILGAQDHAPSPRHHDFGQTAQLAAENLFALPKSRFPLASKNRRDRLARLSLDLCVGVPHCSVQQLAHFPRYGRFATPAQSDQIEVQFGLVEKVAL
jgi:hypothetical protein